MRDQNNKINFPCVKIVNLNLQGVHVGYVLGA